MTPNGAMGANQALESAAAFVNVLRPLLQRNLRNSPMQGITQLEIDACLKEYSDRRRERVLAVLNKSSIGCQAQLKIGPVSEKLWHDLPTMTNADLLNSTLKSFSEAEVLENWGIGSEKVEVYTATAEKVKKGLTLARDATL